MLYLTRLNKLDSFCYDGTGNQTGEAVATHLHSIVEIVKHLEYTSSSFATSVGQTSAMRPTFSDSNPLPPTSSLVDSKLASFSVELDLVRSAVKMRWMFGAYTSSPYHRLQLWRGISFHQLLNSSSKTSSPCCISSGLRIYRMVTLSTANIRLVEQIM